MAPQGNPGAAVTSMAWVVQPGVLVHKLWIC
jgi:hypothetical protein